MKAILLVLVVFAACSIADPTQFEVTLQTKISSHPYYQQGNTLCFVIDGVPARELRLFKGLTYTFVVDGTRPFYISQSPIGGGLLPFGVGVTGQYARQRSVLRFTPDLSAPQELWYQCSNARYMGWKIIIIDPLVHTTFVATVARKTLDHGFYDVGSNQGFHLDGVEGQEIVLVRNIQYTFDCSRVPLGHRFYISGSTEGRGFDVWSSGVTGNGANSGRPTLTFTPGPAAPYQELYYQCMNHPNMGWKIRIVDTICPAGKYMVTPPGVEVGECVNCPAGTYSTGSSGCLLCPPGSYTLTPGNDKCTECTVGHFTPGGTVPCKMCRLGTFSNTTGVGNCYPCEPGTYADQEGRSACSVCERGTRTCGASTECRPCPPGQYSSTSRAYTCNSCPAGTFSATEGATQCDPCTAGTFSVNGLSTCNTCPPGTSSATGATNSFAACVPV